jgi:DNA-binding winged helix-turn-helix (wHTH) protein/alpha-beta hydrolase superfamily lysophospholipase
MSQSAQVLYEFGPYRLNPSQQFLAEGTKRVPLTPKAFQILLVLVESQGQIVSKQELLHKVWPDTFVEEATLAQNVFTLRKQLNDDREAALYIETIPKRGYRFVGRVHQFQASSPGDLDSRGAVRPHTRYARSGELSIAYQVTGQGPLDLVYVPGWVSDIEYGWEDPHLQRFYHRLASFSRLIIFDKRGTGRSDQTTALPTLEERMDDVRAVMDAVGSERAVVCGASEGGNMSILFAATYPQRTLALVTIGAFAKRIWDPQYPWAPTPEVRQRWLATILERWGEPVDIATLAPSLQYDPQFRSWWATYLRRSASPGAALALAKSNTQVDIRHVLPAIRVPTLLLHRRGDYEVTQGETEYMAAQIRGSKHVELPGDDHLPWAGDQEPLLREIEAFLAGIEMLSETDRILTTILFLNTRGLPSEHLAFLRSSVGRLRGHEVECTGSHYVAAFDGPARAIRAATTILQAAKHSAETLSAGLHTGECESKAGRLNGVAIEIARRVAARARPGEVVASATVKGLVAGSGIGFRDRGEQVDAAGDQWGLFTVAKDDAPHCSA